MKIYDTIYIYLREHNHELSIKFKKFAMSKERNRALNEINSQSIPLIKHCILYVILLNHEITPPRSWLGEIKGYLANIDFKNQKKKKGIWFSDEEIEKEINNLLSNNKRLKNILLEKAMSIKDSKMKQILCRYYFYLLQTIQIKRYRYQFQIYR